MGSPRENDQESDAPSDDHIQAPEYPSVINGKIASGELDPKVVASLELQRLVDGCRVPLGQVTVEEAVTEEDHQKAKIDLWMQRPARVQIEEYTASMYVQGSENYNIWYNKWAGDRNEYVNGRPTLTPASYKCDPENDCGYTRATNVHSVDASGTQYICLFFAKGCCTQGKNCAFLHRLPEMQDEYMLDPSVDIFGRERHARHRDDMSGVGSFNEDCKTLFVGDVHVDTTEPNPVESLKATLLHEFSKFGPVTEMNVVPTKGVAFISFPSRVFAEFAKVAMASQPLEKYSTALNVKWAHEMKKQTGSKRAAFQALVAKHEEQLKRFQELMQDSCAMDLKREKKMEEERRAKRERRMEQVLKNVEGLRDDEFDVKI